MCMGDPLARAVALSALHPAPWNPRLIKDERFKNLCRSIEADPGFLELRPVLATADGTIYAGNMRYRAAQHLGMASIPAIVEDVPEQLAKERALRDNQQWGEWQDDDLAEMLYALSEAGSDMDLLGFDDKDLQRLLASVGVGEGLTDPDAVPDDVPAITQPGDLWLLGDHRILCGDATNAEDYDRLLDGCVPDLVLTDPPYGVGVDYASFKDSPQAVAALVQKFMPLIMRYEPVLLTSGLACLWEYPKPNWLMAWIHPAGTGCGPWGFTTFNPVLAYGKDPYLANGKGSRADSIVMQADRNGVNGHPVPKPVEVWKWFVERGSLNSGDLVLDPFLGSGTTVIACEQLGRRCFGLEIEPRYVDVIVCRWEEYTGKQAVRA